MGRIQLSWADVSKWGGIAAMICGAVYMASQKKFDEAYALFALAMAQAGLGAKVSRAATTSTANNTCLHQIRADMLEVKTTAAAAVAAAAQAPAPPPEPPSPLILPPTECL